MAEESRRYTFGEVILIVIVFVLLGGFIGYARGEDAEDGQATDPEPPVVVVVDRD